MCSFSLFDDELIFVDRLIAADVRNNSAWNQRFFVLSHTGLTPEVMQYELNYVMNRIRIVKNNESTWNFLRGLLEHNGGKIGHYPEVFDFSEELYSAGVRSPYLLSFMVDMYQERCLDGTAPDEAQELQRKINEICNGMITTHDTIRSKYWQYVLNKFNKDLEKAKLSAHQSTSANSEYGV